MTREDASAMLRRRLCEAFPAFAGDEALLDELLGAGQLAGWPAGALLYRRGDACSGMVFFLGGEVRVFAGGAGRREITLYEIFPGEACILNASCLLGRKPYPAAAEAVTATEALVLPAERFRPLLGTSAALRDYVFGLFAGRLAGMMELLEEVTFGSIESRLDDYLVQSAEDDVVPQTHQTIAKALGTSREVVSRVLKEFERRGRVALGRSAVRLLHP